MTRVKILLSLILVLVAGLTITNFASATPSRGFNTIKGELFDGWGICRTRAFGEDGFYQITKTTFRPVIAFESLGEDIDLAYNLGKQMASKYPDQSQRAEAIFRFVRDKVNYTPDIEQFGYDEYAQNADELASVIDQNGTGYGDCEDSAVLLVVMFKGAGYRSALVTSSSHTAALVYLPNYKKATAVFELEDEFGWVWAEATGKKNPLGWVPKECINIQLAAYEISGETIIPSKQPTAPLTAATSKTPSYQPFPFISIIGLLWLLSLFRKRRAR